MKVWILKAVVQKSISFLPFKHRINFLFQEYITKRVRLTNELFEDKLTHCAAHIAAFDKYSSSEEKVALEIGTGWYPIVPIGLYLNGFDRIFSVDISSLISTSSVHATINLYSEYFKSGRLERYMPRIDPERLLRAGKLLQRTSPADVLLKELGIHMIVGDARSTGFPDEHFDLINSNNTLEHIYPEIMRDILVEFRRILKPVGIMSHNIDMSDHFSHLDKSITNFNFLQFSDLQWRLIDNSVQPQNRLRISDYEVLFRETGFEILEREDRIGTIEQLHSIKLAPKYLSYANDQLLVTHSRLVSRKSVRN